MLSVVGLHGLLQIFETIMDILVDRHINLCGSGPKHHHALHAGLLLEPADILTDLARHVPAVLHLLDIVPLQTTGVIVVEGRLDRLDCLKLVLYRLYILLLEHLSSDGGIVGVRRIEVPGSEHDVIESCKRHYVLVVKIFFVRAFAYAYPVVLGHGAYWLGKSLAGHEDSCHKSGADRSEPHHHHSEFAVRSRCYIC